MIEENGKCLREICSQECSDVGNVPKPFNLKISDENLTRPLNERQPTFACACPGTERQTADPFMISIVLINTHHSSLIAH
jgi:hypothetical protein